MSSFSKRVFRAVNQKIDGKTKVVFKEGVNGTGITLPFICGFCRDKDGTVNAAFRTQYERNHHALVCPDKG
jgi:hypothetical protein